MGEWRRGVRACDVVEAHLSGQLGSDGGVLLGGDGEIARCEAVRPRALKADVDAVNEVMYEAVGPVGLGERSEKLQPSRRFEWRHHRQLRMRAADDLVACHRDGGIV